MRVELTLYKRLTAPMMAYPMAMLANPGSHDEVQGACATTVPGIDESTAIRLSAEITAAVEGGYAGGDAVVDPANNLTYIDINVVGGR